MKTALAAFVLLAASITYGQPGPQVPGSISKQEGKAERPKSIRIGGNVAEAKLTNKVEPVYPPLARQARISGTVRLHIVVGRRRT